MKVENLFSCGADCFSPTENIDNEKDEKCRKRKAYFHQFIVILSGYVLMLDSGAQIGWTSPALPYLTSEKSEFPVSISESSWLASVISISGMIGCIVSSVLVNRIGRKPTIFFFCFMQLISWILINSSYNFTFLLMARAVVGFSGGGTATVLSIYIGEISDKEIRGTFLCIDKIFVNSGSFLINVLGAFLPYKIMNLVMLSVPITALCLSPFIIETPYYHLMKNRDEKAIKTLMKLSGIEKREMVMKDIKRMKEAVIESQKSNNSSYRDLFCDPGSRRALIGLTVADVTYVLSGYIAIQSYAQEIFSYSGSSLKPEHAAMIMTGAQIFAGIPSSRISDRCGRRPIHLFSGLTTAFTLGTVGLFFFLKFFLETDVTGITWIPLVALVLYQFTCNIGLATIPYVYSGELFSMKVKGAALTSSAIIGSMFSFSVKMMLPFVNMKAGIYTTFWIFACSCVIGSIIVISIVPETKGKNLEEVLELMRGKKRKCSRVIHEL